MDAINILLLVSSIVANLISLGTVVYTIVQNRKILEESTRPVISIYSDEINTGNPQLYLIVKNYGKSPTYITKFKYDFDFKGCYRVNNNKLSLKPINISPSRLVCQS